MGRHKGDGLGKFGGRRKGSTNKVTNEFKDFIKSILNANRNAIITDLEVVEPFQRLQFLEKLIAYVVPKQTQTQTQIDFETDFIPVPKGMSNEDAKRIINDYLKREQILEGKTPEERQANFDKEMNRLGWIKKY